MKKMLAMLVLPALAFVAVSVAGEGVAGIDKSYRVDDRVSTGGQPTPAQLASLKDLGFRTIINLREPEEFDAAGEAAAAKELGLVYVSIPVRTADPRSEQVDAFLDATKDPGVYPVFLHCGSGNRVGAFWMIRRVLVDRWTLYDAEQEARQIGLKSPNLREFALVEIANRQKPGR
jgi:uncharacterized protein (TIGR01244 family)